MFLLILIANVQNFNLPEINIKSTLFDMLVKNNLKEFLKGFLGINQDKICEDQLDDVINTTNYSFQGLFSAFNEVSSLIRKNKDLIEKCVDPSLGTPEQIVGYFK